MKKVLCIGNASYDITFPLEKFPLENTKNRIKTIVECGGGPASNAAYLLGKWGIKTAFAGAIGNDTYAEKLVNELKEVNVNIDYIEKIENTKTTLSCIIVGKEKSSRTILTYRNPDLKLSKNINLKPDVILTDGQEFEKSMQLIKDNPNAISIIDAGRAVEKVIELCKHVNYIVSSKQFAEEVTNIKIDLEDNNTLSQLFKKMSQLFPNKQYVVTLEDKGAIFVDNDGYIKYAPTLKKTVIDTTGAGDIFHGAFTYGIAMNYSLESCVKLGNIAGALSTTKLGSKASIPTLEEVMKIYEK